MIHKLRRTHRRTRQNDSAVLAYAGIFVTCLAVVLSIVVLTTI